MSPEKTFEPQQNNGQSPTANAGNSNLVADVEQFLYYHRSADLTAEVLQVRLLLAILELLGSTAQQFRGEVSPVAHKGQIAPRSGQSASFPSRI